MNSYRLLIERQEKERKAFPIKSAFSETQFVEMLLEFGLNPEDEDKVKDAGCGVYFYLAEDELAFNAMVSRHASELREALVGDLTGEGFIFEMFCAELEDSDCVWTEDTDEVLERMRYFCSAPEMGERLMRGFRKACKRLGINA